MPRGGVEYEHSRNMVEAMTDIRDRLPEWKWSALWKTKGACFYKVRRDGTIRLYRTSEKVGYCWADLKMSPVRGGGTAMLMKTANTAGMHMGVWLLCVMCLFLFVRDWVEYHSVDVLLQDIPYLLVSAAAVLLVFMTSRETPKLVRFVETELGWKRAR